MGKSSIDAYLASFDRYGNGKGKSKDDSSNHSKKKKGGGSTSGKKCGKRLKKLEKRINGLAITIEKLSSDVGQLQGDSKLGREADAKLQIRVDDLEKFQKEVSSQIKTLGKTQKAMQKDLNAVSEDVSAATSPAE